MISNLTQNGTKVISNFGVDLKMILPTFYLFIYLLVLKKLVNKKVVNVKLEFQKLTWNLGFVVFVSYP